MNTLPIAMLAAALSGCAVQAEPVRIDATDKMASSVWIGDQFGMHADGSHSQGTVFITIGPDGAYTARGYYRGAMDCMLESTPWSGVIYRVSTRVYAAVNDGATNAWYVLNVAPGYGQATASLVAKNTGPLIESNELIRQNAAAVQAVEELIKPYACEEMP
jgi:hypothetical protein